MHQQRGISLISLLIGLLVSTVVIIGMMMIFRNTIQTTVPSSESARSEGERVSALLAAHMMLQDAGFGTNGVQAEHLAELSAAAFSGTTLSATGSGTAVVWRKSIGTTHICEGLYADASGELLRLSSSNCGSTGINLASINWTSTPLVREARLREADDVDRVLEISIVPQSCSPFGVSTSITGVVVARLTYSVNVGGTGQEIESTTCLVNFQ